MGLAESGGERDAREVRVGGRVGGVKAEETDEVKVRETEGAELEELFKGAWEDMSEVEGLLLLLTEVVGESAGVLSAAER